MGASVGMMRARRKNMASSHQLDSPNQAVRAIERWKRGFTAVILVALAMLPGAVAGSALVAAVALLGGSSWHQAIAIAVAVLVALPWSLGSRSALDSVGSLAKIVDD